MREVIDLGPAPVNAAPPMDLDDLFPGRPKDPLDEALAQDLDPLSVDELHARIARLEGEIARVRGRIEAAGAHRNAADALFKR